MNLGPSVLLFFFFSFKNVWRAKISKSAKLAKLLPFARERHCFIEGGDNHTHMHIQSKTCSACWLQCQSICTEQISPCAPFQIHFPICRMINLEVFPPVVFILLQESQTSPFLCGIQFCAIYRQIRDWSLRKKSCIKLEVAVLYCHFSLQTSPFMLITMLRCWAFVQYKLFPIILFKITRNTVVV